MEFKLSKEQLEGLAKTAKKEGRALDDVVEEVFKMVSMIDGIFTKAPKGKLIIVKDNKAKPVSGSIYNRAVDVAGTFKTKEEALNFIKENSEEGFKYYIYDDKRNCVGEYP